MSLKSARPATLQQALDIMRARCENDPNGPKFLNWWQLYVYRALNRVTYVRDVWWYAVFLLGETTLHMLYDEDGLFHDLDLSTIQDDIVRIVSDVVLKFAVRKDIPPPARSKPLPLRHSTAQLTLRLARAAVLADNAYHSGAHSFDTRVIGSLSSLCGDSGSFRVLSPEDVGLERKDMEPEGPAGAWFVALDTSNPTHHALRVSFRGSFCSRDLFSDFAAEHEMMAVGSEGDGDDHKHAELPVHKGVKSRAVPAAQLVRTAVRTFFTKNRIESDHTAEVELTGHSLGGAIAAVAAVKLALDEHLQPNSAPLGTMQVEGTVVDIKCTAVASPPVIGASTITQTARLYEELVTGTNQRFVSVWHEHDIVPQLSTFALKSTFKTLCINAQSSGDKELRRRLVDEIEKDRKHVHLMPVGDLFWIGSVYDKESVRGARFPCDGEPHELRELGHGHGKHAKAALVHIAFAPSCLQDHEIEEYKKKLTVANELANNGLQWMEAKGAAAVLKATEKIRSLRVYLTDGPVLCALDVARMAQKEIEGHANRLPAVPPGVDEKTLEQQHENLKQRMKKVVNAANDRAKNVTMGGGSKAMISDVKRAMGQLKSTLDDIVDRKMSFPALETFHAAQTLLDQASTIATAGVHVLRARLQFEIDKSYACVIVNRVSAMELNDHERFVYQHVMRLHKSCATELDAVLEGGRSRKALVEATSDLEANLRVLSTASAVCEPINMLKEQAASLKDKAVALDAFTDSCAQDATGRMAAPLEGLARDDQANTAMALAPITDLKELSRTMKRLLAAARTARAYADKFKTDVADELVDRANALDGQGLMPDASFVRNTVVRFNECTFRFSQPQTVPDDAPIAHLAAQQQERKEFVLQDHGSISVRAAASHDDYTMCHFWLFAGPDLVITDSETKLVVAHFQGPVQCAVDANADDVLSVTGQNTITNERLTYLIGCYDDDGNMREHMRARLSGERQGQVHEQAYRPQPAEFVLQDHGSINMRRSPQGDDDDDYKTHHFWLFEPGADLVITDSDMKNVVAHFRSDEVKYAVDADDESVLTITNAQTTYEIKCEDGGGRRALQTKLAGGGGPAIGALADAREHMLSHTAWSAQLLMTCIHKTPHDQDAAAEPAPPDQRVREVAVDIGDPDNGDDIPEALRWDPEMAKRGLCADVKGLPEPVSAKEARKGFIKEASKFVDAVRALTHEVLEARIPAFKALLAVGGTTGTEGSPAQVADRVLRIHKRVEELLTDELLGVRNTLERKTYHVSAHEEQDLVRDARDATRQFKKNCAALCAEMQCIERLLDLATKLSSSAMHASRFAQVYHRVQKNLQESKELQERANLYDDVVRSACSAITFGLFLTSQPTQLSFADDANDFLNIAMDDIMAEHKPRRPLPNRSDAPRRLNLTERLEEVDASLSGARTNHVRARAWRGMTEGMIEDALCTFKEKYEEQRAFLKSKVPFLHQPHFTTLDLR